MTGRGTDLSGDMAAAARAAVTGSRVRTSAWSRASQVEALAAAATAQGLGTARPIMDANGDLFFTSDSSRSDGEDVTS